jgi:hypothetical protein
MAGDEKTSATKAACNVAQICLFIPWPSLGFSRGKLTIPWLFGGCDPFS